MNDCPYSFKEYIHFEVRNITNVKIVILNSAQPVYKSTNSLAENVSMKIVKLLPLEDANIAVVDIEEFVDGVR